MRVVFGALVLALLSQPALAESRDARLDRAITGYAQAQAFSGTVLVQEKGRRLYSRSFGLANRAFAVPADDATRYRIASITKLFTAVLVMQLVDEGRLDLTSPIRTWLPDYPGEGAERIALPQLLDHTSGIAQFDHIASLQQALDEGMEQYQRPQTSAQLLRRCCAGKLAHPPGTSYDYNNADYIVLGNIVERVTGKSYAQVLSERILAPLGLRDTGMANQDELIARLADTYYLRPDTKTWMNDLPVYFQNWYAAGGLYSTAPDLLAFADALYGGRLVSATSLAAMLVPGKDDYGFGLWSYTVKRGGKDYRIAKRPGSIMGANTVLYRMLDRDTTVVILGNTNKADQDVFAQKIADWLIE